MEIRDSRSPLNLVPFANIKPGETFMCGPNLCMRTQSLAGPNAVVLSDGRMSFFEQHEEVQPVKAYVVKEG